MAAGNNGGGEDTAKGAKKRAAGRDDGRSEEAVGASTRMTPNELDGSAESVVTTNLHYVLLATSLRHQTTKIRDQITKILMLRSHEGLYDSVFRAAGALHLPSLRCTRLPLRYYQAVWLSPHDALAFTAHTRTLAVSTLRPYVHAGFSRATQFSTLFIPQAVEKTYYAVWWVTPASTVSFVAFFARTGRGGGLQAQLCEKPAVVKGAFDSIGLPSLPRTRKKSVSSSSCPTHPAHANEVRRRLVRRGFLRGWVGGLLPRSRTSRRRPS
ncbi:hypothetical protein K438DRAFT_1984509 [Mycena galopus ATCC 62051]|nr:hypothetical protein K438DRAFT_1984509 [Mycena galopus ATCC 62051]